MKRAWNAKCGVKSGDSGLILYGSNSKGKGKITGSKPCSVVLLPPLVPRYGVDARVVFTKEGLVPLSFGELHISPLRGVRSFCLDSLSRFMWRYLIT